MTPDRDDPPKLAAWLLVHFSPAGDRAFLGGDFEEIYRLLVEEKGRPAARRWFRRQCFRSLPRIVLHAVAWRGIMLKNFLKVAWRNLRRRWLYAAINIIGLAVGFSAVILIFLFIRSELAFDAFHAAAPRIYRLNTRLVYGGRESRQAAVAPAVAPALRVACPEIEAATRLFVNWDPLTIGAGNRKFAERRFFYVDPEFFDVFSFPLLEGDPRTVLSQPRSLVLTQSAARKYFPRENPMGKSLTVSDGPAAADYVVRGIAADVPVESHFHFDFLAPFSDHELSRVDNWFLQAGRAYVRLRAGASPADLEAKFSPLVETGARANFGSVDNFRGWLAEGNTFAIFLQPLLDIRLRSKDLGAQIEPVGDIATVRIFIVVAFVVLFLAVFNFIGLSASRSFQRAGEVGLRKILGSSRSLLVRQFLTESCLVTYAALALSVLPVLLLVPFLSAVIGRSLPVADLFSWPILPLLVLGAGLIGLAAGAVPSLLLAAFQPARVLQGRIDGHRRSNLAGVLVVFQFTVSIILFVMTFVILGQMRYIRAKNLGFEKNRLLAVAAPPSLAGRFEAFKGGLLRNPEIVSVACSSYVPGRGLAAEDYADSRGGRDERIHLALLAGDEDFLKTLGLELIAGRFFSPKAAETGALVVNEEAARRFCAAFGWNDPLGKSITNGRETRTIIGVLKDFHFQSLHRSIEPLAVDRLGREEGPFIVLRTAGGSRDQAIRALRKTWNAFVPDQPFEYFDFSEETGKLYQSEKRNAALLAGFSIFAVFLGCLGLFGQTAFSAERRTKEIGIRKACGATRKGIVLMLLGKSGLAVLMANAVAWPAAFLIAQRWFRNYAYRTEFGLLPFIAAGILVLVLACLTAGGTAYKAASADPVKALRYE